LTEGSLYKTRMRSLFPTLFDDGKDRSHYLAWNLFRRVSSIKLFATSS